MFASTHYSGDDLALKFRNGEPWIKVLGPAFVYLNSDAMAQEEPSHTLARCKTKSIY